MSERKINLEDILIKMFENGQPFYNGKNIKSAMLEFGQQLLELAAENAELKLKIKLECTESQLENGFCFGDNAIIVNKQSILNTINQVE